MDLGQYNLAIDNVSDGKMAAWPESRPGADVGRMEWRGIKMNG